jgi:hypothetical protein
MSSTPSRLHSPSTGAMYNLPEPSSTLLLSTPARPAPRPEERLAPRLCPAPSHAPLFPCHSSRLRHLHPPPILPARPRLPFHSPKRPPLRAPCAA